MFLDAEPMRHAPFYLAPNSLFAQPLSYTSAEFKNKNLSSLLEQRKHVFIYVVFGGLMKCNVLSPKGLNHDTQRTSFISAYSASTMLAFTLTLGTSSRA